MAFDPSTAKPKDKPKFDISTAQLKNGTVAQQPVDYEFSQTAANTPASFAGVLSDLYNAVTNPIDTVVAMGSLARSGVANAGQMVEDALPETILSGINRFTNMIGMPERSVDNPRADRVPNQEAGEAYLGFLDDRYGSLDAIKTTAMEDPVGMLLDLSGLLTGGGATAAKMSGTVGKIGEKVHDVGAKIDPITGMVRAPTAVAEIGQPLSHRLYGSAMKPSTVLDMNPREKVISAGLELGALPTVSSTKRIEKMRKKVGGQLEEAMLESDSLGRFVEGESLLADVGKVRDDFAPPRPSATTALPDIDAVVENIREAVFLNGGRKLTVKEVNDIKKDLYRSINWDKAEKIRGASNTMSNASERAMKQIAETARQIVAKHSPKILPLDETYGKIVDVQRLLQLQGTNRILNHDLLGLGAPAKIATGQLVGGDVGGLIGTTAAVADRPLPKAIIGIGVNRAGKVVRSPRTAGALTATSLAGRYEDAALAEHDQMIEDEMANGAFK